jgi:hypothetical protein
MLEPHVRLKDVLRSRHWQVYRTFCREYDNAAKVIDSDLVGTWPSRAQLHRWLKGDLKGLPYPDHCRVLERMLADWTVEQLFEPCGSNCPHEVDVSADAIAGGIVRNIADGLANPDTSSGWGHTDTATTMLATRRATSRATVDRRDVSVSELVARKLLEIGQVQRIPPDELAELSTLAGNLVDLSTQIDLQIAADGLCSVTYRYRSLNLTDRPVSRAPRDLWFQHSRGRLELVALREGATRNAIQRLHTADNIAKFACQLSPPIQPGEAASFGYTCSGAEFVRDFYWRQAVARYTRRFTLQVRHAQIRELAGLTAVEELPDGTEMMAQESVVWDYDGDDVVMTFTRDYLQPNQYVTLRWETP